MTCVSIIIPVYNVADYLDPALRSVRDQTFADWEALVVDDGSTDGSLEKARRHAAEDSRIIVYARPHGGVSLARNFGLSMARGEWVVFFDPDDLYLPHALEKLTERQRKTGALLVYGAQERLWEDGSRTPVGRCRPEGNILEAMAAESFVHIGALLVNRDSLRRQAVEFTPGASCAQDFEFTMKLLATTPVAAEPSVVHLWRCRAGSTTTTGWSWEKYRHSDGCFGRTADFIAARYSGEDRGRILRRLRRKTALVHYHTLWWRLKCADDAFVLARLRENEWQESLRLLAAGSMPPKQRLQYWLLRTGRPWLWRLYRRIYGTEPGPA